jgi:hypothetical protein
VSYLKRSNNLAWPSLLMPMPVSLTATIKYIASPDPHSDDVVESRWKASFSSLKYMTLGGYDVGRLMDVPIETVMFLSPFFLDVNFIALVIKLTRTGNN